MTALVMLAVVLGVGNIVAAGRMARLIDESPSPSLGRKLAREFCIVAPMTTGVLLVAVPPIGLLTGALP